MSRSASTRLVPDTAERIAYLRALPALSLPEAAELAGVGLSTLRRAIAAGRLQTKKIGPRRVVVPARHLMVWIGAEDDTAEADAE